jgi:hypothetical protein
MIYFKYKKLTDDGYVKAPAILYICVNPIQSNLLPTIFCSGKHFFVTFTNQNFS